MGGGEGVLGMLIKTVGQNLDQEINYLKHYIWSLSLISDFPEESLKAKKTSKKDLLFYNADLLQKLHSLYKLQLIQYCKKYAPATQPKTLLTLQIFP